MLAAPPAPDEWQLQFIPAVISPVTRSAHAKAGFLQVRAALLPSLAWSPSCHVFQFERAQVRRYSSTLNYSQGANLWRVRRQSGMVPARG